MVDQSRPHLYYEHDRLWENYHQTLRFTPARYYDAWNLWDDSSSPETRRWYPGLKTLQQIIRDAEEANMPVRALGGGWSLSNAAMTPGFLVNTRPLNVIEVGLRPESCDPRYLQREGRTLGAPETRLVFAQCGANIAELSAALESRGLSLPTSGASNGQTICGAMSTGTHGAAWRFGSVQDYILGVHLISEGGIGYWIERESNPVVSQKFCDILEAKLLRSDRLFDAVRVAFGSFGIIHAVVLQAEPIFVLERHVIPYHYDRVLPALSDLQKIGELGLTDINGNIPAELPFHFEVLLNPYSFAAGQGRLVEKQGEMAAYVRYMYKHPAKLDTYSPTGLLLGRAPGDETISNDAFDLIGKLGNLAPLISALGLMDSAVKFLLEGQLKPENGVDHHGTVLTHGGTFDATKISGHSQSCELGFDRTDVPRAVEIIINEMLEFPFACVPALRYAKDSAALLAFTKFAPYTCAIEFPTVGTERSLEGYRRIWKELERQGITYTFHWGQALEWGETPSVARKRLEHVFGDRLTAWLDARKGFLSAKGRQTFSSPLLEDCGIAC